MIRAEKVEKLREKGLKLKELVMMDDETLDRCFKETIYGVNVDDLKSFFKVMDVLLEGDKYFEHGDETFFWESDQDIKTFKAIFGLK